MKKFKNLIMSLITVILSMLLFATTALAYSDESTVVEETESVTEAEESTVSEIIREEPMEPLTPDGNLTLVDDEGPHPSVGKQFITVVSKSGNYFYLIIDRDEEGKETVHFLNQVDEEDLFALMEEEEVEKIKGELTEKEKPLPMEPETTAPDIPKPEPEPEKKGFNWGPTILVLVIFGGFGGVALYLKVKDLKKGKVQGSDPDGEFVDESYLVGESSEDSVFDLDEIEEESWADEDEPV